MELEDIKEALYNYYEIEDDEDYNVDCGCFINGKWLSIEDVLKIIKDNM